MRDKFGFIPNAAVAPTHHAKRDELQSLFDINKNTRRANADIASAQLVTNLTAIVPGAGAGDAVHTALHTYEKAHLNGGGNWPRFKATLLLRYRGTLRLVDNLPVSSDFMMTVGGREERIGTIFFEESRFQPLVPRPWLIANDVFTRRNDTAVPPRHYIALTTSATHVKRYVTRGLSAFDAMRVDQGLSLISVLNDPGAQATELGGFMHNVLAGVQLNDNEQILTHTRGWGGNKRFISTGVSNRPALSTRGVPFLSMYGAVTVDLAMVPVGDIFDVHRHDVASARLGVQASTILTNGHHTNTGDINEQKYLGLRDTIRTRELLIKGGIPNGALRRTATGQVLLGIGSPTSGLHTGRKNKISGLYENGVKNLVAGLPVPIKNTIVNEDHMTFRDPGTNKYWHFLEFNSVGARQAAQLAIGANARTVVAVNKYAPLRPVGMV